MATYAIGDIQGCFHEFQALLDHVAFNADRDQLWIAGDLVNRGPDSLSVLRFIRDLGDRARVVLGNHDLHLLAVGMGLRKMRRSDTLERLLIAPDAPELLAWLQQQPLLVHDESLGYAMTHAGIPPQWHLAEACALAAEVERVLRSQRAREFFEVMFGNSPECWHEHLAGDDRLRFIVNAFTRMRFINAQGCLELKTKAELDQAPEGYAAWFTFPLAWRSQTQLVFGHWAALEGHCPTPGVHALDTGCVWGGPLTALRLEDGQRFSVASEQDALFS
ncbi:bis(5'-nucleosyl)-tetraphosphatase (symmetrical) [Terasakiispira papahanaumokuakeensis]|uniref:Bis(5'-nucleosyl)-tetraphosphatase, symmetrical n=1 Tax=Terasakiispira papahanaumokuakeensis TaxID=197479 RepID=A0A1E2V6F4_9GAMM|nr:symmetrical bis(5'-nucleosyl)-tetraphosphatase [Terasakiispira papahanaumokuakeensis]ODC02554.1 bis(5'-nucleosyl)-tetraphosphatase (symmetrical) [Terasakiispira papahanaumokuakeensis]